jgi:hypothetical protein
LALLLKNICAIRVIRGKKSRERSEEHLVNQKKSHFFIRYFSGKPFKFLQFWFIQQHFASTLAIHG